MGGVFGGKPKKVAPPPVPPPVAIPEVGEEVEETTMKRARRRRGYAKTIITGSLEPEPKGKTLLG